MPGGNLPTLPVKRVVRPTPSIPDHEVVRQIGSGAYGEVWLAKSLTGAWRAVKIVWREDFEDERSFNREFEGILPSFTTTIRKMSRKILRPLDRIKK